MVCPRLVYNVDMYTDQPPIRGIIELADRWSFDAMTGVFKAMAINNLGVDVTYWVTEAMLNTCHPKLGVALRALCHWELKVNADDVRGMYVRYTLLNFENKVFSMTDHRGTRQLFHMINNLKLDDSHPDEVQVIGIKLLKWVAPENFDNVEVVSSNIIENQRYPKSLLTAQFPGWEKRLNVHQALELGYDEIKTYVLSNNPNPVVDASVLNGLNLTDTL